MTNVNILVEKILAAKQSYYTNGNSNLSDFEYDALEEQLRAIDPSHPVLSMVGIKDLKADFTHKIPMLSQSKALTDDDIYTWVKQMLSEGHSSFIASSKLDGMSCSLHYENGHLLHAVSRGDGQTGVDMTAKASFFVPITLNIDFTGEIRGEVLMPYEGFEKLNASSPEPFTHPRNAAVGVINEEAITPWKCQLLEFRPWQVLNNSSMNDTANPWFERQNALSTDLDICAELGFKPAEYRTFEVTPDTVESTISPILRYFEEIKEQEVPKDGVVFRIDENAEYEDCGYTAHHPRGARAWKFCATKVVVEIEDIEWSVGTRDISPVAKFKPVLLDGAEIHACSLKSVKNMLDLGVTIGSKCVLVRQGGVIPHIEYCVD